MDPPWTSPIQLADLWTLADWLHEPARRYAGAAVYGLAATAAAWAAVVSARGGAAAPRVRTRRAWTWAAVALAHTVFALEMRIEVRYMLVRWGRAAAESGGWYADRRAWQIAGLLAVALLVAGAFTAAARYLRPASRAIRVALAGTTLSLAAFGLTAASLHHLDGVIYTRIGPLLAVSWMCLVGAACAAAGAMSAGMSGMKKKRPAGGAESRRAHGLGSEIDIR